MRMAKEVNWGFDDLIVWQIRIPGETSDHPE
jgi:hypothetical protein